MMFGFDEEKKLDNESLSSTASSWDVKMKDFTNLTNEIFLQQQFCDSSAMKAYELYQELRELDSYSIIPIYRLITMISLLDNSQTKQLITDASDIDPFFCYSTFLSLHRIAQLFPKQIIYQKLTNSTIPSLMLQNHWYEQDYYLLSLSSRAEEAAKSLREYRGHVSRALTLLWSRQSTTEQIKQELNQAKRYHYSDSYLLHTTILPQLLSTSCLENKAEIDQFFQKLDNSLSPSQITLEHPSRITSFLLNVLSLSHPAEHPAVLSLQVQPHYPSPSHQFRSTPHALLLSFYQLRQEEFSFGPFMVFFAEIIRCLEEERYEYLPHINLLLRWIVDRYQLTNSSVLISENSPRKKTENIARLLQTLKAIVKSHQSRSNSSDQDISTIAMNQQKQDLPEDLVVELDGPSLTDKSKGKCFSVLVLLTDQLLHIFSQ